MDIRVDFDTALSTFMVENTDTFIAQAIEDLGQSVDADYCYFYWHEITPEFKRVAAWSRPPRIVNGVQNFNANDFTKLIKAYKTGKNYTFNFVMTPKNKKNTLYNSLKTLTSQDTQSLLLIPIILNDILEGFIWLESTIINKFNAFSTNPLLPNVANAIGNSFVINNKIILDKKNNFLTNLDRLSVVLAQYKWDKATLLKKLVEIILEIFDADRVWLLYPCDSDAAVVNVVAEANRSKFPNMTAESISLTSNEALRNLLQRALAYNGPLSLDFNETHQPSAQFEHFYLQNQIVMVIRPAVGQPWLLGLYTCNHNRSWTQEDKHLLHIINKRLGDALENQLLLENLKNSEYKLRQAQRIARFGSWQWDYVTHSHELSEEIFKIFDIAPNSNPSFEDFLRRVNFQDVEMLRALFLSSAIDAPNCFEFIIRLHLADEVQKSLLVLGETIFENGKAVRSVGTAQDITPIKEAEQALRNSEKRLQTIVENMPVMLVAVDKYNNINAWNREAERLTGYSAEEMIGNSTGLKKLYPDPVYRFNLIREWKRRGDNFRHWELAITTKNGARKTLSWSNISELAPIPEWAWWGVATDVTDRKIVETALISSEKKYRSLLQNIQAGVMVLDTNMRIIDINRKACDLFGVSETQAIGKVSNEYQWTLIREDGTPLPFREFPVVRVLAKRHSLTNLIIGVVRSDKQIVWVIVNADPIFDTHGAIEKIVVTFMDITERRRSEVALQEREFFLRMSQKVGQVGSYELDLSTSHIKWSDEMYQVYGMSSEEFDGTIQSAMKLIHPKDLIKIDVAMRNSLASGNAADLEYRILHPEGTRWVRGKGQVLYDNNGKPARIIGTVQNITERKQVEDRLRQAATVFENTHEGVTIMDARKNIVAINRAFTKITGYTESEILGKNADILQCDRHDQVFYQCMWQAVDQAGVWEGEIWNRRKTGEIYPEWLNISAVKDRPGNITHYVLVFADISPLKHAQEKFEHLAHHDPLTGLPNRLLFSDRLKHAMQRADRNKTSVGILYLDLDRFKHVNDSLGHSVGDALLLYVGQQLLSIARRNDTVARLGGDEFIILMEGLKDSSAAAQLAEKISTSLKQAFHVHGHELFLGASIGISIYPQDGDDVESLLRNADVAMYQAKDVGNSSYRFYTSEMTTRAFERLTLENQLRRAITQNELLLHYQPQIDLSNGQIAGLEALIRWNHPHHGLISPGRFIHIAEETGIIVQIGEWVLRSACAQGRAWLDAGVNFSRIAVNVAVPQMRHSNLVQTIQEILLETNLPPECLELEITETFLMGHGENDVRQIKKLRDIGIQFAIDDFGTGYSSLAYLKQLPIDKLKIDQGFIRNLPKDENDAAIAKAVIALGHSLQFAVIAEGVENDAQRVFLRNEGCDQYQGFFFSKPLTTDVITKLLIAHKH